MSYWFHTRAATYWGSSPSSAHPMPTGGYGIGVNKLSQVIQVSELSQVTQVTQAIQVIQVIQVIPVLSGTCVWHMRVALR